ncbi:MAG: phospho-N-acetylmuramoyl-pentapeptide-transferase [Myxococcota bacterium]
MLFHLLWDLHDRAPWLSWLNVVRYVTFRAAAGFVTALLLSMLLGPLFIRLLQRLQVGQTIRDDGPQSHLVKAGTPTMGGALIVGALTLSTLLWCDLRNGFVWAVLGITVGYAAIGFLDDFLKLTRGNSKGLPGKAKLAGQLAIGAIAVLWLLRGDSFPAELRLRLALPFLDFYRHPIALPLGLYAAFGLLVVVGSSNAVNLTDGLDGLAIGPVIIAASTFAVLAYASGTVLRDFNIAEYLRIPHIAGASELVILCAAMAAASIGFLWYNSYPASVFMGDVGSLGLGGGLGMMALATKSEAVWAIFGGVFVVEALSVMVQVVSFRLTGRRIFKMAPLHHHYELHGWDEPKIVVRAWILSLLLAMVALATLKMR